MFLLLLGFEGMLAISFSKCWFLMAPLYSSMNILNLPLLHIFILHLHNPQGMSSVNFLVMTKLYITHSGGNYLNN